MNADFAVVADTLNYLFFTVDFYPDDSFLRGYIKKL
jgi:hypothetical protein